MKKLVALVKCPSCKKKIEMLAMEYMKIMDKGTHHDSVLVIICPKCRTILRIASDADEFNSELSFLRSKLTKS